MQRECLHTGGEMFDFLFFQSYFHVIFYFKRMHVFLAAGGLNNVVKCCLVVKTMETNRVV